MPEIIKQYITLVFLGLCIAVPLNLAAAFYTARKCRSGSEDAGKHMMYCNTAILSGAPFVGNMKRSILFMERGIIYSRHPNDQGRSKKDFDTALLYAENGPNITGSRTAGGIKIWTQYLIDRIALEPNSSQAAQNWKNAVASYGGEFK